MVVGGNRFSTTPTGYPHRCGSCVLVAGLIAGLGVDALEPSADRLGAHCRLALCIAICKALNVGLQRHLSAGGFHSHLTSGNDLRSSVALFRLPGLLSCSHLGLPLRTIWGQINNYIAVFGGSHRTHFRCSVNRSSFFAHAPILCASGGLLGDMPARASPYGQAVIGRWGELVAIAMIAVWDCLSCGHRLIQ